MSVVALFAQQSTIIDFPPTSAGQEKKGRTQHLKAIHSSVSVEWYTPRKYIDAVHKVMGGIDLDPASNAYANQVVRAIRYYTEEDNGLLQLWPGRVFVNPPYGFIHTKSSQGAWSKKLIESYEAGITAEAILLVTAVPEKKWFQPLYDYAICFTDHRIYFYNASRVGSQPAQGSAFVYFGKNGRKFAETFSEFGPVFPANTAIRRQKPQPLTLWQEV